MNDFDMDDLSFAEPPPPAFGQPPQPPQWNQPPPPPQAQFDTWGNMPPPPQPSPARSVPRNSPLTIDPEADVQPWALRTPTRAHVQRGNTPMSCDSPFRAFAGNLSPLVQLTSPPAFGVYQEQQAFFKSPQAGAFGFGGSGRMDFDSALLPPTPRRTLLAGMDLELSDDSASPGGAGSPAQDPFSMPNGSSNVGTPSRGQAPAAPAFSFGTPVPASSANASAAAGAGAPMFGTPAGAVVAGAGAGAPSISPGLGGVDAGVKRCNCRKSRCLKLYCECFAANRYCEGCGCSCCSNTVENEELRQKAMAMVKRRNPNAFKRKIIARQIGVEGEASVVHVSGCNCRRSQCLKNYCECHSAGILCGPSCKCTGCQNYDGSPALMERQEHATEQHQQRHAHHAHQHRSAYA